MTDPGPRSWRTDLAGWMHRAAYRVEDAVDVRWRHLRERLGLNRPVHIQSYTGYANAQRAWLSGRVLANRPVGGPQDDDKWWDNLLGTYQRWASDEVPGVRIEASLAGQTLTAVSDDEGYFAFEFALAEPLAAERLWHEAHLYLPEHPRRHDLGSATAAGLLEPITAVGRILCPPASARFVVVSDIDDTVLDTGITDLLTAARLTFLSNAKTRKPLEGVAELYHALQRGTGGQAAPERNPVFYVSSSAWNLYDLLVDFLDLDDVPAGPVLLRDLGIDAQQLIASGHEHKLEKVERLMAVYPHLPFVLVGDSGQHDARLYLEAIRRHGRRVIAAFIRDVDPGAESPRDRRVREAAAEAMALGVEMHPVSDSTQVAEHAVRLGLIRPREKEPIREERDRDRQRPEV